MPGQALTKLAGRPGLVDDPRSSKKCMALSQAKVSASNPLLGTSRGFFKAMGIRHPRIGGWHMWNQMKRQITTRKYSTRNFTSPWISRNCSWCWGLSDFSISLSLIDLILSLAWMICYQSWIPLTHESIWVFQPTPRRARLHRHGDVDAECDWRPYKPGYFIMIHHLSNKQRFHQSNVGFKQLFNIHIIHPEFGTSSASCFLDLAVFAKRPGQQTSQAGQVSFPPPTLWEL